MGLTVRRVYDTGPEAVVRAVIRNPVPSSALFRVGTGGRALAFDAWRARRLLEDVDAWNSTQDGESEPEPNMGPGNSELVSAIPRGAASALSSTMTTRSDPDRLLRDAADAYLDEWDRVGTDWNVRRLKALAEGGLSNLDWPALLALDMSEGGREYAPDAAVWDLLVPGRAPNALNSDMEDFRGETLDAMHREFAAGRDGESMAIVRWGGIDPPRSPFRGMFLAGKAAQVAFRGIPASTVLDGMRGKDWFGVAAGGEMDSVLVCGRVFPTGRTVSGMVLDPSRPAADPFGD